jgi:D-alanyl-D-alanine carboxypeptidase (penicillin-binding protein 5/6)
MLNHIAVVFLSLAVFSLNADAKPHAKKHKSGPLYAHYTPLQASLVVDADTGRILHSEKAKDKMYPASTVKMMTLYLAYDAIEKGKLSMNSMLPVSKHAEKQKPCKIWLKAGEKIALKDALVALHVKSANDAAVTIAEAIAGSEEKFAVLMNKKAKELGIHNTNFTNATGWHNPNQHSTAVDLAKLAIALENHHGKHALPLMRKNTFAHKGQVINTHDKVLAHYPGAKVGKTGFHCPGGFNIVTTAERNGKNLVAVVTGGHSQPSRNKKITALLDTYFGVAKPTIVDATKPTIQKYRKVKLATNYKNKKYQKQRKAKRVA